MLSIRRSASLFAAPLISPSMARGRPAGACSRAGAGFPGHPGPAAAQGAAAPFPAFPPREGWVFWNLIFPSLSPLTLNWFLRWHRFLGKVRVCEIDTAAQMFLILCDAILRTQLPRDIVLLDEGPRLIRRPLCGEFSHENSGSLRSIRTTLELEQSLVTGGLFLGLHRQAPDL